MATAIKTNRVNSALLTVLSNLVKDPQWATLDPVARLRRSLVEWVRVKKGAKEMPADY